MKLFPILNKPVNKANNKQAGIVFLEYVIMAFIVTVAVICALWWFYWHLQQMTWEVKQKLDTLKTLNCELSKPEGEQPTPAGQIGPIGFVADGSNKYVEDISYPNQKVTIHNDGGSSISGYVYFLYFDPVSGQMRWRLEGKKFLSLDGGKSISLYHNHDDYGDSDPYSLELVLSGDQPYTVTVTQLP